MEQEIPKELNRAEPEKEAKNRVTQLQEDVSVHNQALDRKETRRKCTQNTHGGSLRTGEVTDDTHFFTVSHICSFQVIY